jgi:hypothetical protein
MYRGFTVQDMANQAGARQGAGWRGPEAACAGLCTLHISGGVG